MFLCTVMIIVRRLHSSSYFEPDVGLSSYSEEVLSI